MIYPKPSRQDKKTRSPRARISSKAQEKLNLKRSFEQLEELIYLNFPEGFWWVTLTYDDEHLPESREKANYLCNNRYLGKLRRQWRRKGAELRRITATQQVQTDGSLRLHHHLILSRCDKDDFDAIVSLWGMGHVKAEWLTADDQYTDKALYMTHEPRDHGKPKKGEKTWSASRNLLRPEVEEMEVPDEATLEPPYGAEVLERDSIRNEWGEYAYLKYRLPRPPGPGPNLSLGGGINV